MSYFFSSSSPLPPSQSSTDVARTQLSTTLVSMGFATDRIAAILPMINVSNEDAIDAALELLTRPIIDTHALNDSHSENDSGNDSQCEVLTIMTGCSMIEARRALRIQHGDLNAAAEYLLQSLDTHSRTAMNTVDALEIEAKRLAEQEIIQLHRASVRERVNAQLVSGGDGGGGPWIRYGQILTLQFVDPISQSRSHARTGPAGDIQFVLFDSEATHVTLTTQPPLITSPAFASPKKLPYTTQSSLSPITLTATSGGAVLVTPPVLTLTSSQSSASSRSLLSTSPAKEVKQRGSIILTKSSTGTSADNGNENGGKKPLTLNVQQSPGLPPIVPSSSFHSISPMSKQLPSPSPHYPQSLKPRSFSSPRKSSNNNFSFTLPHHYRYEMVVRNSSDLNDTGCVLDGDRVLIESYERCFLAVEADGSASCNRLNNIDTSMEFLIHTHADSVEDSDNSRDIAPIEYQSLLTFQSTNHCYLSVDPTNHSLVAKDSSLSDRGGVWRLSLVKGRNRTRICAASKSMEQRSLVVMASSPIDAHADPDTRTSSVSKHWQYLRANYRLIALSLLNQSIEQHEHRLHLQQLKLRKHSYNNNSGNLCIVCMDQPYDSVLLECGHLCVCHQCVQGLTQCLVCRSDVTRTVRINVK